MWPAYKRRLQRSKLPILVGPFRGEVGFEALYWVPFLRKLGIAPERMIPITRGGAHVWYPAKRHVELFDLRSPKAIRCENIERVARTGKQKQIEWTAFDREIVADAAKQLQLTDYLTLHPHWMYNLLDDYWEQRRGLVWAAQHLDIQTYAPVDIDGLNLPQGFVAVRFYGRPTFPVNDMSVTVATEIVKLLARQHPVILLNSGIHADEHVDIEIPAMPNVAKLSDLYPLTPQNNLLVQSAVLTKAAGFVGTYGGLAQLALMYKKPTISLYQEWFGTMIAHKHYADAVALQLGLSCQVIKIAEIPLLHAVLPPFQMAGAGSSQARQAIPA